MVLIIRSASVDELPGLSDLCFRSKAVWGYDEKFMEACRRELSFDPQDLEQTHVAVAEGDRECAFCLGKKRVKENGRKSNSH